MQARKQNSSVTGAMNKLRRVCRGAAACCCVLPVNRSCSNGPANRLAVSRVGLTIACRSPSALSPSKGSNRSLEDAICSTIAHCGHTQTCCNANIGMFWCIVSHVCKWHMLLATLCKRMQHPWGACALPCCTLDDTMEARQASL